MRSIPALLGAVFAAAGCSAAARPEPSPSPAAVAELPLGVPGRVRIDGSAGLLPLATAVVEGYRRDVPDADVSLGQGLSSKVRIQAVIDDRIDVALASHGLDLPALAQQGLAAHRVAVTPVVFAVHVSVGIVGVSEAEVCALYTGAITNWQALGGGAQGVRAFARPESEVDMEVLRRQIPCLRNATLPATVARIDEAPDMARVLAETPGAFGVTTASAVEASGGRLRPLSLGGVAPTPSNTASGRYRLTRDAYLVTREPPTPAVAHLLRYIRSPRGAALLAAVGSIPAR